jgi:hypothetical protein
MSTIKLTNIDKFLTILKLRLNLNSDYELAERLGYSSTGTISNWRKRGSIDVSRIVKYFPEFSLADIIKELESENNSQFAKSKIPQTVKYVKESSTYGFVPYKEHKDDQKQDTVNEPAIPYAAQVKLPQVGELSPAEIRQLLEQIELLVKIVKGSL